MYRCKLKRESGIISLASQHFKNPPSTYMMKNVAAKILFDILFTNCPILKTKDSEKRNKFLNKEHPRKDPAKNRHMQSI